MKKNNFARMAMTMLALAFAVTSCQPKPAQTDTEKKDLVVRVGIITTRPIDFAEIGVYYGKLAGVENAALVSILGGRVDAVDAAEGREVSAGQSLGRINAEKARATWELVALNEKVARGAFERQKLFLKDGNASQASVDQAELAWLTGKNTLIDARHALDSALCISPIAGVVTRKFIEAHQELSPGAPTFSVSRIDRMKATIGIPEQEIAGVAVGNMAEVSMAALPGMNWKGTLSRLSRELSPLTLTFAAEVLIDNPNRLLLPGTTAKVSLRRRNMPGQIMIPTEAVLTSGQETYIMVERAGVARRIPVVVGPGTKTHTVILKGLTGGENVIVQGNNLATDGAAVLVTVRG
jgi:membrane fusion protein (multidrug efflux system)